MLGKQESELKHGQSKTQDETSRFPLQVTMSIFMSFISAILVLGNTAEMYLFGVQYYVSLIGSIFSYLYIASVLVPVFYELKLTSTFVVRRLLALESRLKVAKSRSGGAGPNGRVVARLALNHTAAVVC